MRDYDIYIFDFDGTLVNSYPSLIGVYKEAFAKVGQEVSKEEVAIYMHEALTDTCKRRNMTVEETKKVIIACEEILDYPEHLSKIFIYDDVVSTIEALAKKGKKIAIVSGNTSKHIHLTLQRMGIDNYFSVVEGSKANRKPKPYPDVLWDTLKEIKASKEEKAVYIGDSLQDPECAFNAGIDGILLERNKEYPDYKNTKIESLSELLG